MLSLEVLHVEIAQKLQNLEISLIFSHFLMDFQFSPIFFGVFWKKIPKRGQMSWNWCQPLGKHDFWAKICSRAKIAGGGSRSPPPTWRALSDVTLARVKTTWSEFEKASQTTAQRGKAELRILNFKTTWSMFQKLVRLQVSEAKPSYVYSISKPHGQSFRNSNRLLWARWSWAAYS